MATVTVQDLAALQYCAKGARQACASAGIDYLDFVRKGIAEEVLRDRMAPDDEMVKALIDAARKRESLNG